MRSPVTVTLSLSGASCACAAAPTAAVPASMASSHNLELLEDRKSTRLNPVTNAHLVCRLLLEKKKLQIDRPELTQHRLDSLLPQSHPLLWYPTMTSRIY